jgi:hypothetical protein
MTQAHLRADCRWIALEASLVLNLILAAVIGGNLLLSHARAIEVSVSDSPLGGASALAEVHLSPQDAAAFHAEIVRGESHYAFVIGSRSIRIPSTATRRAGASSGQWRFEPMRNVRAGIKPCPP